MTRTIRSGLALAAALVLLTAQTALGIVFGEVDENGGYPNVGALFAQLPDDGDPATDEGPFQACSGTLIAPTVYLTAAHCVNWAPAGTVFSVSFESPSDPTTATTGTAHAHPRAWSGGMNDAFDIAVVVLDRPQTGIDPAPLPSHGQLSRMSAKALRSTTFTAVGYGSVRQDKKGGWHSIDFDNVLRRYAHQSPLSLTKAWLTLSMNPSTGNGGTCYGDSGGPHFLPDGTVASITVTGDRFCRATDKTYRIDTRTSLDFLSGFLRD